MTPDRTLLTIGPNGQNLAQPLEIDPSHPHAITFCVLEGAAGTEPVVVINHWRPHMYVYNGLNACDPGATPTQWKRHLEEYQAQVVSGELTREVLERFQQVHRDHHGFPRYAVTSGRLWRHLKIEGQPTFSVMAFWNHGLDQPEGPALEVVKALKVEGPVYLVSSEKTHGAWHDLPFQRRV
jgi:hypothetical protein